ncbi:hypothetical protein KAM461_08470 [Aeromonas hydrophila]|nr:hypothetical protein KAM461_08470 [Aeromonas hydrophila]
METGSLKAPEKGCTPGNAGGSLPLPSEVAPGYSHSRVGTTSNTVRWPMATLALGNTTASRGFSTV